MYIMLIFKKNFSVVDQPSTGVKSRLKENIAFWEHIGASSWVLKVIREGYVLPFVDTPAKQGSDNHRSALKCEEFVTVLKRCQVTKCILCLL